MIFFLKKKENAMHLRFWHFAMFFSTFNSISSQNSIILSFYLRVILFYLWKYYLLCTKYGQILLFFFFLVNGQILLILFLWRQYYSLTCTSSYIMIIVQLWRLLSEIAMVLSSFLVPLCAGVTLRLKLKQKL